MNEETRTECSAIARELVEELEAAKASAAAANGKVARLARLLESTEASEDLETKVGGWLGRQGFPLEFRVARAFASRGFTVTPSHYVEAGEKTREIDVRAVWSQSIMQDRMSFELFVECKWSKRHPWVVFASPDGHAVEPPLSKVIPANGMGEALLWLLDESPDLLSGPPFVAVGVLGHGGRQALTDKQQDSPDAFYSAMQSVTELARAAVYDPPTITATKSYDARFTFPVVVVDAPLFKATLPADADELVVSRIPRARVYWRGASADRASRVDVVTADSLPEFVEDCLAGIHRAHQWLGLAHSETVQALRSDSADPIRYRFQGRKTSPAILVPQVLMGLAIKAGSSTTEG